MFKESDYDEAVYTAHESAELALKGLLLFMIGKDNYDHDLEKVNIALISAGIKLNLSSNLVKLKGYYIPVRYCNRAGVVEIESRTAILAAECIIKESLIYYNKQIAVKFAIPINDSAFIKF